VEIKCDEEEEEEAEERQNFGLFGIALQLFLSICSFCPEQHADANI